MKKKTPHILLSLSIVFTGITYFADLFIYEGIWMSVFGIIAGICFLAGAFLREKHQSGNLQRVYNILLLISVLCMFFLYFRYA